MLAGNTSEISTDKKFEKSKSQFSLGKKLSHLDKMALVSVTFLGKNAAESAFEYPASSFFPTEKEKNEEICIYFPLLQKRNDNM